MKLLFQGRSNTPGQNPAPGRAPSRQRLACGRKVRKGWRDDGGVKGKRKVKRDSRIMLPGFFREGGQVVDPIVQRHAYWIDQVREIVFRVGQHERGVAHFVGAVGAHGRFFCRREIRGDLRGVNCSLAARQSDESLIEMIEPLAQDLRRVAIGIGGNKNHFKVIFGQPAAIS